MLTTTETLLQGLAAGDNGRWARFYRDYAPILEDFLASQIPELPHADIEEVISDALIAIAKIMPTYRYDRKGKGPFHSFLYGIVKNKAVDRLRKYTRDAARLERFAAEPPVFSDDDWRRSTYDAALRRVWADPAIQGTSKLAFRRYVQLGEPAEQVAADLNLSVNALYHIRDRFKKRLKEEIAKLRGELPDET